MAKTYNVMKINVKDEITSIITMKQHDLNSRYLDVYLMDDGTPINLTGHEVRIYGRKPDGTDFFNEGEITDAVNGRCQFELTNQALAVVGNLDIEISIWQNGRSILTTQTFTIFVTETIRNDDVIESSNEFGALVLLFQKLYDFIADVTELLNLVGQPANTGGTTTAGTIMAKLNALLGKSSSGSSSGGGIKSVQRGSVYNPTLNGNYSYSRSVTFSNVNLSKSFVIIQYGATGGTVRYAYPPAITNVTANSIALSGQMGEAYGSTKSLYIYWQVIEFY